MDRFEHVRYEVYGSRADDHSNAEHTVMALNSLRPDQHPIKIDVITSDRRPDIKVDMIVENR